MRTKLKTRVTLKNRNLSKRGEVTYSVCVCLVRGNNFQHKQVPRRDAADNSLTAIKMTPYLCERIYVCHITSKSTIDRIYIFHNNMHNTLT